MNQLKNKIFGSFESDSEFQLVMHAAAPLYSEAFNADAALAASLKTVYFAESHSMMLVSGLPIDVANAIRRVILRRGKVLRLSGVVASCYCQDFDHCWRPRLDMSPFAVQTHGSSDPERAFGSDCRRKSQCTCREECRGHFSDSKLDRQCVAVCAYTKPKS
jgi:hypothetical protein